MANTLRDLRQQLEVSQLAVALAAGVSPQAVARLETKALVSLRPGTQSRYFLALAEAVARRRADRLDRMLDHLAAVLELLPEVQ